MDKEIWSEDGNTMIEIDDEPDDELTADDWDKCRKIRLHDDPASDWKTDKIVWPNNPILNWDYYLRTGGGDEQEGIVWGLLIKGDRSRVIATAAVTEFI